MSSQSFPIIGAVGGAVIGSLASGGNPAAILKGMQIGATVGSLASGLTARPSAVGDAHFPSVTYGTPVPYCWAPKGVALDCAIIWVDLGSNGSYLTGNGGPGKGKSTGEHYSATFAV